MTQENLAAQVELLENALALLHRMHPRDVAFVCDARIDTTGALLGRVRAKAWGSVRELDGLRMEGGRIVPTDR